MAKLFIFDARSPNGQVNREAPNFDRIGLMRAQLYVRPSTLVNKYDSIHFKYVTDSFFLSLYFHIFRCE